MRIDKVKKNIRSTALVYLIKIVLQFIVRMILVKILPVEYLGINGLFTNILAVLSLSELGIGPAMVFSLYKPLAVNDTNTVCAIMSVFKKSYIVIGLLILVSGFCLTPWLDFFLKEQPDINHLQWIYLIFVLDTGISYFYSYKRSLLIADQKQNIANFYQGLMQIILGCCQCVFLIFTESYWSFIILKVIATLLENILVARRVDVLYPYLKNKNMYCLSNYIKKDITKNVKALFFGKLGGIVVFSSTNIIISKYIGLSVVGLYSNYLLIINAVNAFLNQLYGALTASIGNLAVLGTDEKKLEVFKVLNFITASIAAYISIGFYLFFNPVIIMWLGKEYIFSTDIVILISINFYLTTMRKPSQIFEDAFGLFWQKRYMPIPEIIINLTTSLIGAKYFGLIGILLAVTVSTILVPLWFEPYVILKNRLRYSFFDFWKNFLWYCFFTFVIGFILDYIYCYWNPNNDIVSFALEIIAYTVLFNIIWIMIFYNKQEFKYLKNTIIKKHDSQK